MLHLLKQQFLLTQKMLQLALRLAPLADILDGKQERRMRVGLGDNRPRIEQHGATANLGELVFDLEGLKHRFLRDDFPQQRPQRRNVPLAIAQCVEQPSLRFWRSTWNVS